MENRTTETTYVEVTNRNNGITGYTLNSGMERIFNINETKKVPLEELQEVEAMPGGEYLLRNYLMIKDKTALDYLNVEPEPEYFYTENEIKELLLNGTLDQLEDCLNFAPQGVLDILKDKAVSLEIPDMRKRDLISKKLGFNIDNAIKIEKAFKEDSALNNKETTTPERKSTPVVVEDKPVRKASSKYNVVSK